MNFDQADTGIIVLLAILGISILIAIIVIAKTISNEAKEKKEKSAQLAADRLTEEKSKPHESQVAAQPKSEPKPKKPKPAAPVHKDDVTEDDDLIAAAEVYLTYELKEQAITSLEKHLLTNPTDKKALALLKKAEASD